MTNMVEKKGKKRRSPMDLGIFMYSVFDFSVLFFGLLKTHKYFVKVTPYS